MAESAGVIFKIKADSDQAEAELKKFKKELDGIEKSAKDGSSALERIAASSGLTATQFSSLKTSVLGATAVIGGLAAAGAAVVGTLFQLAKSASEYGGAIFDASEKTGASTDSLQALKFAAEQSGSSFEGVTNAVAKFNVLIGNAVAGSNKAQKALKDYGITSRDTDTALVQAISTIAKMTDSTEQATAAAVLFKDRTGEILPVIKSFDGDLPGLIDKLRDLGLLMSRENTEAADQFGDQMDLLNKQLDMVKVTIGTELMPVFLDMANQLSGWLATNQGEVEAWGRTFADVLSKVGAGIKKELNDISELDAFLSQAGKDISKGQLFNWEEYYAGVEDRKDKGQIAAEAGGFNREKARYEAEMARYRREMDRLNRLTKGIPEAPEGGTKKAVKDKLPKFDFSSEMRDYQKALRNLSPGLRDQILKYAEEYGIPASLALAQLFSESGFRSNVSSNQNAHGIGQLQPATASRALGRKITKGDLFDIDTNLAAWGAEMSRLFEKYGDWALAVLAYHGGEGTANAFLKASASGETSLAAFAQGNPKSARYAQKIPTLAGLSQSELIGTVDVEKQQKERLKLVEEFHKRQHELSKRQWDEEDDAYERRLKQGEEEAEAAQAFFEAEMDRLRQLKEEHDKDFGYGQIPDLGLAPLLNPLQNEDGSTEQDGPFDAWTRSWDEFFTRVSEEAPTISAVVSDLGDIMQNAFVGLAQAIGNVIQQWVLYGKTGPAVMRQILAAALASVAAEAAVKAIMATAEGFYFLATHQYDSAALAFTAAAFYGSVAAVAAVAGRVVAGNSFNQQSSRATGQSSSSGQRSGGGNQGQAYSPYGTEATVYEQSRNQPAGATVQIGLKDGASRILADLLTVEMKNNGPFRDMIRGAAEG